MKTNTITRRTPREVTLYVLAYVLWLVTLLICILAVLQLRVAVNAVCLAAHVDRYTLSLIDQLCIILGGFLAFLYVMYLEHYYREGVTLRIRPPRPGGDSLNAARIVPKGRVWQWLAGLGLDILLRRFALTFAIPLCLILLALVVSGFALGAMVTSS